MGRKNNKQVQSMAQKTVQERRSQSKPEFSEMNQVDAICTAAKVSGADKQDITSENKAKKQAGTASQERLKKITDKDGMLVYGVGAHLADMLGWHPDLAGRIARIFDKDEKKHGLPAPGLGKEIEAPTALKNFPSGTEIAISAIRYFDEISAELHELNPGLICIDIDEAYQMVPVAKAQPVKFAGKQSAAVIHQGLNPEQRQRLRGKEALARWRQRMFMECVNCHHIFWGVRGVRASYLRREFKPLMQRGDIFIEEDASLRGQVIDGLPVCVPDVLKDIKGKILIIVLASDYTQIRERLLGYGYVENVDFVEGRYLLGEDESGYLDMPCIEKSRAGMIVYGNGIYFADFLKRHPELVAHITRIVDVDPMKIGNVNTVTGIPVESYTALRDLPRGTEIAITDLGHIDDITKNLHALQPELICKSIDEIWQEYV